MRASSALRWTLALFLLGLFCLALAAAAAWFWLSRPLVPPGPSRTGGIELVIPPGSAAPAIGFLLADAGLDITPTAFARTARVLNLHTKLRAGVYLLKPGDSLWVVLQRVSRGEALQESVTIIEGWTFAQALRQIQSHPGVRVTLPPDPAAAAPMLAQAAGLPLPSPEGWIFPDTYLFDRGSSDLAILVRSVRLQQRVLAEAWEARNVRVAVASPYEALIVASMIEKETQVEADRNRVSAVFHNRLRIDMPLQSDPTVIYALGPAFDGNLRRNDLRLKSEFNTYYVRGLPPTPIANPGRAALVAAMSPDPIKALYFVAKGNGHSYFSETLARHNHAVNHFQRQRGPPPPPEDAP